ncbi:hypothetical protein PoB_002732900 [Plakobranchus ocellatus]|uniref:Uncharacterized protein n=1 Tax=Plakobranchus ocellatus TaxID=259542 RepID=A0AAV4A3P8_9GAST|nr:hypothetical protein PoB_002732900 [Plakobranchus ocellatus]
MCGFNPRHSLTSHLKHREHTHTNTLHTHTRTNSVLSAFNPHGSSTDLINERSPPLIMRNEPPAACSLPAQTISASSESRSHGESWARVERDDSVTTDGLGSDSDQSTCGSF